MNFEVKCAVEYMQRQYKIRSQGVGFVIPNIMDEWGGSCDLLMELHELPQRHIIKPLAACILSIARNWNTVQSLSELPGEGPLKKTRRRSKGARSGESVRCGQPVFPKARFTRRFTSPARAWVSRGTISKAKKVNLTLARCSRHQQMQTCSH